MNAPLDQDALDQLFYKARSHNAWLDRPLGDDILRELYQLTRMAPTSANCCPARIVFLRSPAAKERLRGALNPGNVDKAMTAPVTAIIGYDLQFYERLPFLFPHKDIRASFAGNRAHAEATAFRNSSLQGAYFMLAARALGLDCGPMSGFDQAMLDREFFAAPELGMPESDAAPQTLVRTNFLCNLGYGDSSAMLPRLPRLDFDAACLLL